MNPSNIPFNALIVGPTNSGQSRFVADQIDGHFCGKFDYIVLICLTLTQTRPTTELVKMIHECL